MERTVTAAQMFLNARQLMEAYTTVLKPLCLETGMPQMAMDILLFLANNPDHATANEICRLRGFKPGIVSVHVDKLVSEGLLQRESVPGDRRKTSLTPTNAASDLIARGRAMQKSFAHQLMEGLSEDELQCFMHCLTVFHRNIDRIRNA